MIDYLPNSESVTEGTQLDHPLGNELPELTARTLGYYAGFEYVAADTFTCRSNLWKSPTTYYLRQRHDSNIPQPLPHR